MLLDQPNRISYERSIISDLVIDADMAFESGECGRCIDIIREIYALLDLATAGRIGRDLAASADVECCNDTPGCAGASIP